MVDILSGRARSALMSRVRQHHTAPERAVRSSLHRMGFRFRLHRRDLPGTPDIVLPRYSIAIFVHGCFWHRHVRCRRTTTPKTRTAFWMAKFRANVMRDHKVRGRLASRGWRVITIWECQTSDPAKLDELLRKQLF